MSKPISWGDWAQAVASIVAALGLLYLALERRAKLPRLKFDFEQGGHTVESNQERFSVNKQGRIRNLGSGKETIARIGLVMWRTKYKEFILFNQYDEDFQVQFQDGSSKKAPFEIGARDTIKVNLLASNVYIEPGAQKLIFGSSRKKFEPAIDISFCFETTDGCWFDEKGKLIDLDSADWRWRMRAANLQLWRPKNWLDKTAWYFDWRLTASSFAHQWRRLKRWLGVL